MNAGTTMRVSPKLKARDLASGFAPRFVAGHAE
jgi:hypothetical protein